MLIALTGYAGSGKDTIADHLVESHGYVKLAFADPLRELAMLNPQYAEIIDEHGGYEAAKRAHGYIRNYLIQLGEGIRSVDRFFFAKALSSKVLHEVRASGGRPKIVVTDLRRDQEVEALEELGFSIAVVHRPGVISEPGESLGIELDDEWLRIHNNGDVWHLHEQVDKLVYVAEWARRAVI